MDLLRDELGMPKEAYDQILQNIKRGSKGFKNLFKNKIREEDAEKLESIRLEGVTLEGLDFLKYFKNLEEINLSNCYVKTVEGLHHVPRLKYFVLYDTGVGDLTPVCNCIELEMFEYMIGDREEYKRSDFECIRQLQKLWEVDFTNNDIEDVSFLIFNKNLKEVILTGNPISNLASLVSLSSLELLEIEDCKLTSLDGLGDFYQLERLYATGNELSKDQIERYRYELGHIKTLKLI